LFAMMSPVVPAYFTTSKRREKPFSCQTMDGKNCEGNDRRSGEIYGISSCRLRHFDLKSIFKVSL
jgi:hypothetical protein